MVRKTAKHVARNKKKYWRKISTQDIEDQLEDVRVQEMTGYVRISNCIVGCLAVFSGRRSEQPDHVLYQIDTERPLGAQSPSAEDIEYSAPIVRAIPKKREKLDLNDLNTYKILQPHSSVPPAGTE